MPDTKYPRGVEVVVGVFIFGADGRVALANSPKWDIALIPTGGHLEPGETIAECAIREALEETGLRCKFVGVLNIGEILTDGKKTYNRKAHLIYLHTILVTADTNLVPQAGEINTLDWFDPESETTLRQLNAEGQDSLKKATAYLRGEFELIDIKG